MSWLAAIRPIPLFLLLIGECTAQEIHTDLVGMKRSHVQVKMKRESFIDYQKTHVTYRLSPEVKQTVLYDTDTCKAFYWSVLADSASVFEELLQANGLDASDYRKTEHNTGELNQMIFLVERNVEGSTANVSGNKNERPTSNSIKPRPTTSVSRSQVEFKASQLPEKEQRTKTNWDTINKVSVFGWKVGD